jgi:hypothetical protein
MPRKFIHRNQVFIVTGLYLTKHIESLIGISPDGKRQTVARVADVVVLE